MLIEEQRGARQSCPNAMQHTPCPAGYMAWHAWAERMAITHRQLQCPECGLWAIWVPKGTEGERADA